MRNIVKIKCCMCCVCENMHLLYKHVKSESYFLYFLLTKRYGCTSCTRPIKQERMYPCEKTSHLSLEKNVVQLVVDQCIFHSPPPTCTCRPQTPQWLNQRAYSEQMNGCCWFRDSNCKKKITNEEKLCGISVLETSKNDHTGSRGLLKSLRTLLY